MNRNVLIVMAGGFLVAVIVAMVVQATLKTDRKKQPLKEEAKVQVVVAAKALKAGEVLTAENMKWQAWPESGVFEGLLKKEENKKITDIASGKVRRPMALNEPITKSAIVAQKANYLAASMKPGMRAVAISANARSAAGGFIAPGDYVDIILTYRFRESVPGSDDNADLGELVRENVNRRAAETIMQNVKVLAVDQSATRNEEKVKSGKVFTMEVDQMGAQVLALASSVGSIDLILRPLGDDAITAPPTAATDARMTNLYDELVKKVEEARGGSGDHSVRVFSGNTVNSMSVSP